MLGLTPGGLNTTCGNKTLQVIGQLITNYGNIILVSKSEVFQHFTISENADCNYKANSNIIKLTIKLIAHTFRKKCLNSTGIIVNRSQEIMDYLSEDCIPEDYDLSLT